VLDELVVDTIDGVLLKIDTQHLMAYH